MEKVQEVRAVGKGARAQGQEREIPHRWMDSKVREEVAMRSRDSKKTKAWSLWGGTTDFGPYSSVMGIMEGTHLLRVML